MKEILKAGKKPVTEHSLDDLGLAGLVRSRVETVSVRAPQQAQRKQVILRGGAEEAARALLDSLNKEGIL
jgi:electron transfer flavoprotein alpha/beta subunit